MVSVTRDGGAHWRNVTPASVVPYGRIDNIDASPSDAATAFVVVDRHLMGDDAPHALVTHDYGASWRSISGDLPSDDFVRVVRQDEHDPKILYAGSEHAVWVSFDEGHHWQSLRLNLGTVAIYDMRVQPQANDLVIATHGRGFFVLDDLNAIEQLPRAVAEGTAFFATRTAFNFYHWWTSAYGTHVDECCAVARSE